MTARFLRDLVEKGFALWVRDGELGYRVPEGATDPADEIRMRRDELIAEIGQNVKVACCSMGQERLWAHCRYAEEALFYNLPDMVFRLEGDLDVQVLERCFREFYRRHEGVRTVFREIDGVPIQAILLDAPLDFVVTDLSHVAPAQRKAVALEQVEHEMTRPFDLEKGPLFKVRVYVLSKNEHVLAISVHHIVFDGVTGTQMTLEVNALYAAFQANEPSPLPPVESTYADFAWAQRRALAQGAFNGDLEYWRRQLGGDLPALDLPTDRPRPAIASNAGDRIYFSAPGTLRNRLRELARAHDASFFATLLATLNVLLHRYSRQKDILVGTASAGRTEERFAKASGFFVNTLVVRTDFSGDPTFTDLLHQVRDTVREAAAHRGAPFEKVLEAVQPYRDLSVRPLHQITFVLAPQTMLNMPIAGIRPEHLLLKPPATANDIAIIAHEMDDSVDFSVDFSRDLFDSTTMARMISHWRVLLESIAANPEERVSRLNLLPEEERTLVVEYWNGPERELGPEVCLHGLFEAMAAETPDAPACVCGGSTLTYGELNARSNQLARLLVEHGTGPERLVGISMAPSLDVVVAVLAVLKAGGGFVPLDPTLPAERLAFMIEDGRVRVVITTQKYKMLFPAFDGAVVFLDNEEGTAEGRSSDALGHRGRPSDLAYVIYTSGSTGTPKGVMVEHRSVCNLVRALGRAYEAGPGVRVLLFLSFGFDAFVGELLTALCNGATAYLPPREPGQMVDLGRELKAHAINLVALPAPALQMLPDEEFPHLHTLIVGGETCPGPLVERWARGRRFINAYGPTECTVTATLFHCPERTYPVSPPIGRPIDNVRAYIVDECLSPTPLGVPGELLIGGVGVARGYLNQPERTAEAFIVDPFVGAPEARLYRTGDLCRFLPDGNIEFLGRMDQQVKIHGFRIELGEIESVLCRHKSVREAAVLTREDVPGNPYLAAYVVAPTGTAPEEDDLREFLHEHLPAYMVPQAFVALDELPMTPNGKIDRRALPEPTPTTATADGGHVAPRTPLERYLADIWKSVLGVPDIGVHDDFFDCGGGSLKAAVFTNRLQSALDEFVYVTSIYQASTIAEYAIWLRKHHPAGLRRVCPDEELPEDRSAEDSHVGPEEEEKFRSQIAPLRPYRAPGKKNPPAVFVLSPPRSGSTLLRVMMAGHPRLFAPPELMLLSYNDLSERKAALRGQYSYWLEGSVRALMELHGIDSDEARRMAEEHEDRNLSIKEMYGIMQEALGDRYFVDKSPLYCLDVTVLQRAEAYFENARYIHLLRHPLSSIRSFEEARLDETFEHPQGFTRRQLAELMWLVSHGNILEFKKCVPANRWMQVRFEDLVKRPRETSEAMCEFLDIPFDEAMLDPYSGTRMTDGIHAESQMLGDMKFHKHQGIDAKAAERWKEKPDALGDPAQALAALFGYEMPRKESGHPEAAPKVTSFPYGGRAGLGLPPTIVPLRPTGTRPPLFLAAPAGGTVFTYFSLAHELGPDQPVYALVDPGCVAGGKSLDTVEELATLHVSAIRKVQPHGPYHLAGWSFGGATALEIGQQLMRAGESVAMVGFIESWAWMTMEGFGPLAALRSFRAMWPILGKTIWSFLHVSQDLLYVRTAERRSRMRRMASWPIKAWQAITRPLFGLLQRSEAARVVSEESSLGMIHEPSVWRILWTVVENVRSMKRYCPRAYPGHIVIFRADQMLALPRSGELGTIVSSLSEASCDIHLVGGNHYSILRYPDVKETAKHLREAMAATEENSSHVSPAVRQA